MLNDLHLKGMEFPVFKKDFSKIEEKINFCVNIICYENNLIYYVYVSNKKFENCMNLLLITDEHQSHYVYIKYFNRFMCNKTKNNNNNKNVCRYCLQCFISERVLIENKENC